MYIISLISCFLLGIITAILLLIIGFGVSSTFVDVIIKKKKRVINYDEN